MESSFTCDVCGQIFDANYKLYRHKAEKHVPAMALVSKTMTGKKRPPTDADLERPKKFRRIISERGDKRGLDDGDGDIPGAKYRKIGEKKGEKRSLNEDEVARPKKYRKIDGQGKKRKLNSDPNFPPAKSRKIFDEAIIDSSDLGPTTQGVKRLRYEDDDDEPESKWRKVSRDRIIAPKDRCDVWKREVAKWKRKHAKVNKDLRDLDRECKEKIEVMRMQIEELQDAEDEYDFRAISSNVINSVNIEEFNELRSLISNGRVRDILRSKRFLIVLQKLFLGLSYGIIPITSPQSLAISPEQKTMIRKLENANSGTVKEYLKNNMESFLGLFSVIEDSLRLVTDSYRRFTRP